MSKLDLIRSISGVVWWFQKPEKPVIVLGHRWDDAGGGNDQRLRFTKQQKN